MNPKRKLGLSLNPCGDFNINGNFLAQNKFLEVCRATSTCKFRVKSHLTASKGNVSSNYHS